MRPSLFAFCVLGGAALFAAATLPLHAQEAQPAEQAAPDAPPLPKPGLIDELGKLLKKPVDMLPSLTRPEPSPPAGVQDTPPAPPASAPPPPAAAQAPPSPPAAPPQVAAPPTEPPSTRFFPGVVTGREICPRGANGAPDCQLGSDNLCRSKGYKGGRSLNTDSSFSCSVRQARAPGHKPCGTEHYVTSAFCN